MKLIKPYYVIESCPEYEHALGIVERSARTCYKSEDKISDGSAEKLIRACIKRGHESVIEHGSITVRIICDRGVSHELVRHRLASYSQESQRYCAYRGDMEFIKPCWWGRMSEFLRAIFTEALEEAEKKYKLLLKNGIAPQGARAVLPNATKTEVVVTANFREWRHIFRLRCAMAAHPEMRRIMIPLLGDLNNRLPVFFADIAEEFCV